MDRDRADRAAALRSRHGESCEAHRAHRRTGAAAPRRPGCRLPRPDARLAALVAGDGRPVGRGSGPRRADRVVAVGLVDEPDAPARRTAAWDAGDGTWLLAGPASQRAHHGPAVPRPAAAVDARPAAACTCTSSTRRRPWPTSTRSPRRARASAVDDRRALRRPRRPPARRGRPAPGRRARRRASGTDGRVGADGPRRRRRLGAARRGPTRARRREHRRSTICSRVLRDGRPSASSGRVAGGRSLLQPRWARGRRAAPSCWARSTPWTPPSPGCGPPTCPATRQPGGPCGCTTDARCSSHPRPTTVACGRDRAGLDRGRPRALPGALRLPLPSAVAATVRPRAGAAARSRERHRRAARTRPAPRPLGRSASAAPPATRAGPGGPTRHGRRLLVVRAAAVRAHQRAARGRRVASCAEASGRRRRRDRSGRQPDAVAAGATVVGRRDVGRSSRPAPSTRPRWCCVDDADRLDDAPCSRAARDHRASSTATAGSWPSVDRPRRPWPAVPRDSTSRWPATGPACCSSHALRTATSSGSTAARRHPAAARARRRCQRRPGHRGPGAPAQDEGQSRHRWRRAGNDLGVVGRGRRACGDGAGERPPRRPPSRRAPGCPGPGPPPPAARSTFQTRVGVRGHAASPSQPRARRRGRLRRRG